MAGKLLHVKRTSVVSSHPNHAGRAEGVRSSIDKAAYLCWVARAEEAVSEWPIGRGSLTHHKNESPQPREKGRELNCCQSLFQLGFALKKKNKKQPVQLGEKRKKKRPVRASDP